MSLNIWNMIFKRDSPLLGLLIGLLVPVIFYFLQENIIPMILGHSFDKQSMQLFAIVFNLPFFRYYLININCERTGKGILFATFLYALIWIYINNGNN